jgi:hypothetical protein
MQENHLKPNKEGYQDNPQDLLNASLIFARALGLIMKEGEGIVIDVAGEVNLGDDTKKVIVFEYQNQVHIYKCEEDLPEGTVVNMDPTNGENEIPEAPVDTVVEP